MILKIMTPDQVKSETDQELFDRISSDSLKLDDWKPNPSWLYIGAVDDKDDVMGFFMLHPENDNTLCFHVNFKLQHRGRAKEATKAFLAHCKKNLESEKQKLTAKIPVIYPEVYHFAKGLGFEDEGLCKKSIMKNGRLVDQHIVGLQRKDI
jgi:RimJ/RimL family protein N-acetyltransferase